VYSTPESFAYIFEEVYLSDSDEETYGKEVLLFALASTPAPV
jgi:hypothetical protein